MFVCAALICHFLSVFLVSMNFKGVMCTLLYVLKPCFRIACRFNTGDKRSLLEMILAQEELSQTQTPQGLSVKITNQ